MHDLSRRSALLSAASMLLTSGGVRAQTHSREDVQPWLKARAAPVRTIDPLDENFSDLEPLADAIGTASAVQLGEPSHGAGSCFAAKARIVKFLHQCLGFDALIWESGLYDVALADAAMRSSDQAIVAAQRGIFTLWSAAAEVRPLFEYIKASQATLRPLQMAGFDLQVTADGSIRRFAEDLRAFAGSVRDASLRQHTLSLANQAIEARRRLFRTGFAEPRDLESLAAAAQELYATVRLRRADSKASGARSIRHSWNTPSRICAPMQHSGLRPHAHPTQQPGARVVAML